MLDSNTQTLNHCTISIRFLHDSCPQRYVYKIKVWGGYRNNFCFTIRKISYLMVGYFTTWSNSYRNVYMTPSFSGTPMFLGPGIEQNGPASSHTCCILLCGWPSNPFWNIIVFILMIIYLLTIISPRSDVDTLTDIFCFFYLNLFHKLCPHYQSRCQ